MSGFSRCLDGTPLVLVREDQASPELLAPEERTRAAALTHEKRRREWLLGRAAAKAALGRFVPHSPSELLVEAGPDGAPSAFLRRADGSREPLPFALSITHGHGQAAAWALPRGEGLVGVDLEQVRPRPEGTFRFYLDPAERAPLAGLAGEARDAGAVVLWALKEAAWKTLSPPRGVGLIDLVLPPCDPSLPEGELAVGLRNGAPLLAAERGVRAVRAWWRREGSIVYAWALAR